MIHAHGPIPPGHAHSAFGGSPSAANKLLVSTIATLLFVVLEVVVGLHTNALALIGDAFHNLTDAVALGLALVVAYVERRPATSAKSFGYQRAGILAAFVNAGVLVGLTIMLFIEAGKRFRTPEPVQSGPMIVVAAIGIALNFVITIWLRRESHADMNIRAAVVHLFADTISSAGVIVAALLIVRTGLTIWDPIVSIVIGGLVLWSSWSILREAVNLLLEGTPSGIDPEAVSRDLAEIEEVLGVHHLHIWALAPSRPALSCHVMLGDVSLRAAGGVLYRMNALLEERYGIVHTTIQVEHSDCESDDPFCAPASANGEPLGVGEGRDDSRDTGR